MKQGTASLIFLLLSLACFSQKNDGYQEFVSFWAKTDSEFKDPELSPLPEDKVGGFDSVPRFEYNPDYRVTAEWLPVGKSKPFYFETTGSIKQKYRKVGLAKFKLGDQSFELSVYKNLKLSSLEGYEDYLFIPYTDDSNGLETYGGGKYLSLHAEPKDSLVIDFNQSYNPYCAYNESYSCPIPPRENFLKISIPAGARSDH